MKKATMTFVLLCTALAAGAQEMSKSDEAVIDAICKGNAAYTSIVSTFRQVKHVSVLGEDISSTGDFYYDKPGRLAMRYTTPAGDLMLIDGDRFVMVSAGKRSETTAKASSRMRGMRTILAACLSGDLKQMGAVKISCTQSQKYHIVTAEIDTKSNKSNISRVTASYDPVNKTLSELRTEEPDGSYIVYSLSDKKYNQPFDDAVFTSTH